MFGKGEKKKGVEERLRVKTVGAHIESGSQKRAKRDKDDQFVKNLPKLTKFYPRPTSSTPTPEPIASSSTSNARDSEKSADDIDLSISPTVDSDNGADSDDSSDDRMSLSSVYSNASRPFSTLVNVSDSECALVNLDCNQSSDPGLWLLPFSSELVDFWIEKGPIACQNNDGAFLKSKRVYNAKGKKKKTSFVKDLPTGNTLRLCLDVTKKVLTTSIVSALTSNATHFQEYVVSIVN
ncbi:hypothetical protein DAPPUDRAFT_267351 [Daphnia pulex]|uniref:Uncharacterized protein n=1 Tax=Daphnia pulex TaxID=6669 RepID=E9HWC4_DAPPU|nr:hypothetical protein DAPPUDRAFT_267351 [Daphnia pulex]|eukprot:EFX63957.1 hypothetical protein DAPPUDRAFT_267351 [Daphnia pulex]